MRCARRLTEMRPALDADAGWIDITVAGLVVRLRNLVDIMQDCQLLREAIAEDRNPDLLKLAFMPDTSTFAVPHRDHGLALLVGRVRGAFHSGLLCVLDRNRLARRRHRSRCSLRSSAAFLAGVDDPLPTFRSFYGVFLIVIAITWNLPVWGTATDHDP